MDRVGVLPPTVSVSPFRGKPCPPGHTKKRDQCIPHSELPEGGEAAQEAPDKPVATESSPAEDYEKYGTKAKGRRR